uniref:hypothetical protein n=1 Tax=Citrobacter freundii TaxID=546 RepID=UPI003D665BAC
SERIPAAAGIVNLRYKSCPEMAGQDHVYFNVHNIGPRKKQPQIFLASLMVYSAALRFDIALFH